MTDLTREQIRAQRPGRLRGDYREMCNIRCPLIDWQATSGNPPTSYLVTLRLPMYVDQKTLRDVTRVRIDLPDGYFGIPPTAKVVDRPAVFHPNVFREGGICTGTTWDYEEGLGFFTIRIAKMLLCFEGFTNPDHPANRDAAIWYKRNRSRLPLDRSISFPDPNTGAIAGRSRITIVRRQVAP